MTGTALATQQAPAALAIQAGQTAWTDMQLAALSQLGVKDAGDGDRAVFLHQCQRTGLDPFARQIYMIGRNEKKNERRGNAWVETWTVKWTIQTGIDGYRVNRDRAERKNGARGTLGRPIFYDHDGNEYKVWVQPGPPAACEITYTVRDASGKTPYTSVLRFDEYVQVKDNRPVAQWATKPAHMLEKCTEADVYRKAYPQDFSGIHLDDAMPLPDPDAPAEIRQRGHVTVAEVIDRQPAPAAPAPNGNGHNGHAPVTAVADPPPAEADGQHEQAAEPAADEPELNANPGSATREQLGRLGTLFESKFAFKRTEGRQVVTTAEQIVGRELTGPADGHALSNLSQAEARKLIDTLDGIDDRGQLVERLAARTAESG